MMCNDVPAKIIDRQCVRCGAEVKRNGNRHLEPCSRTKLPSELYEQFTSEPMTLAELRRRNPGNSVKFLQFRIALTGKMTMEQISQRAIAVSKAQQAERNSHKKPSKYHRPVIVDYGHGCKCGVIVNFASLTCRWCVQEQRDRKKRSLIVTRLKGDVIKRTWKRNSKEVLNV